MFLLFLFPLESFAGYTRFAGLHELSGYGGPPYFNGESGVATEVKLKSTKGGAFYNNEFYFADSGNSRIRKVNGNGFVVTVAGSGVLPDNELGRSGFSGDGGPATQALLSGPSAVTFDEVGNMYIADTGNHRIRKVDQNGIITTFAGDGSHNWPSGNLDNGFYGYGDPALEETVALPVDIRWLNGELYVASETQGVFYVSADGYYYLIKAGAASGLALDKDNNLYAAMSGSEQTDSGNYVGFYGMWRIFPDKTMLLVQSSPKNVSNTLPLGNVFQTSGVRIKKMAFDNNNALIVTTHDDHQVYKIFNGNQIKNILGFSGAQEYLYLAYPDSITIAPNGRFLVADTAHSNIYIVDNLNENGMTPVNSGVNVDGTCGLDATSEGEMFSCNPVNLATGTKVDYVLDLGHNSPYPISWGRYYHSKKGAWTFEYERKLRIEGNMMYMERPDGVLLRFKQKNNAWLLDMADNKTVVNVPTTIMSATIVLGYEYKNLKDEIERYDAEGRLQYIQSKEGWRLTMQYDGFDRLIKVSDSFNHVLNLSYSIPNSNNVSFLTSASDGERTIQYTFVRGNNKNLLTKVTNPLGYFVQYKYDTSNDPNTVYKQGRGLLTEIIAENGWRSARYTYDSMDRATSTVHFNLYDEINRNEFYYYDEAGVTDFVQNGLYNTAFVGKKWYTNGASKPRNILSPCLTCIGSKYRRSNYDERGNPIEQFDFNNVKSVNTYDTTRNLPTSKTQAVGKPGEAMTAIAWHPIWRVPTEIVEEKMINDQVVMVTTSNMYNTQGQLTSSTIQTDTGDLPRTQTIAYNGQKLPHIITDAMGRATTFTYDQYGNILTETNNVGHTTSYSDYTTSGIARVTRYPNGLQQKLTLDANQQVTKIEVGTNNSSWRTTTLTYDERGLVTNKLLPNNAHEFYQYDNAKRLVQVSDGFGSHEYQYDEYSRVVKETKTTNARQGLPAPPDNVKEYTYDEFGRILNERTNPYWNVYYTYDKEGNITQIQDPNLKKDFTYDEFNQLTSENVQGGTNETPTQTNRTYYSNGMLKSASDERNVTTVYQYNGFGELNKIQSPDTGVQLLERNKNGEVVKTTDARNVVTEIVRDGIGRIVQKNISTATSSPSLLNANQQQIFVYDGCPNGVGMVCSITNYSGTQTYAYNFWGDVMERSTNPANTSLNFVVKYTYDNSGMLIKTEYPSNRWKDVFYYYDNPITIRMYTPYTWKSTTGTIHDDLYGHMPLQDAMYFPLVNTFRWSRNLTGETLREYDTYGNITKLVTPTMRDNGVPSTSPGHLSARTYLHSWPFNNIFTQSQGADGVSEANYYDHSYKGYLTHSFIQLSGGGVGGFSAIHNYYEYDLGGNRTRKKQGNTPEETLDYAYEATSNRLTGISQPLVGTQIVEYDPSGNIISDGSRSYVYDGENRLRTSTAGVAAHFEYNALGQRVKKDGVDGVEYFIYDEQGRILGVYQADGTPKEELVWSKGWTPVATIRGAGEKTAMYYIEVDHLNAPTHIRNEAHQIVWSWNNREAFGYIAPNEDVDSNGTYFEFNLRFPGQWFDKETALFHNGFRDYNPSTGRYMQSDPLGLEAGFNTYAYVGSNPYRAVDPYGLDPFLLYLMPFKHQYGGPKRGREYLCTVGQNCNVEAAKSALMNNAYPGQTPGNPVSSVPSNRSVAYPARSLYKPPIRTMATSSCSIRNETRLGHIFHKGTVDRKIVQDGGNLYVETSGQGVNFGLLIWGVNMMIWEPGFREANGNIKSAARGEK